jgi:hypothetical protein
VSDDRRIDEALQRLFAPPAAPQLVRLAPGPRARWPRLVKVASLAAAAVLLAALLLRTSARTERAREAAALPAMWVAAYHDAVARGFEDVRCCDGDPDLRGRCRELFAAAIDLAAGSDVELCGSYCGLPAGGAAALLARAAAEPVCLFVLPRERAPAVPSGVVDGLRIHRRELGDLVVFEVTRLDAARVLPHLYVPEG